MSRMGRRVSVTPIVLVLPALAFLLFFIVVPMAGAVRASLSESADATAWTLANYVRFFRSPFYLGILLSTAVTSFVVTALALVFGFPIALYLAFANDRLRRYVILVVISPLLISVVVRAYGLMLLFAPNSPISRVLPAGINFELLYTRAGVISGLVYTLLPFMVLSITASLNNLDRRVLYAAYTLGAGTVTVVRRIVLPLTMPGIIAGAILVFILSMTSVALPLLLGGTSYKMIVYLIYQQFLLLFDWPFGYALSIVLLAATGILLFISRRLTRGVTGAVLQ